MREAGLVTNGAPRRCKVLLSACLTWYPREGVTAGTEKPVERRPWKGTQGRLFG